LHGPWELVAPNDCGATNSTSTASTSHRVKLPGAIGDEFLSSLGNAGGSIVFKRSFGTPTGLSADQIVELVIESVSHPPNFKLNGQVLDSQRKYLGSSYGSRIDITNCLVSGPNRNRLEIEIVIEVEQPNQQRPHVEFGGEIRLEIIGS
jgi:hypothetical protein